MTENTKINWRVHWIELRAWIEQNPKAARAVGLLLAIGLACVIWAIFG